MSARRRDHTSSNEQHFPEAISQWRLALRTEVKNASSLPTSVFRARDPVLEMRLAETTETMLAQLHEPTPQVSEVLDGGEQRIETVTLDELHQLPRCLRATGDPPIGLDDHLAAENLAVWTDACCSGHDAAAAGAIELLRRDYEVEPRHDPEVAAWHLLQCLEQALIDLPGSNEKLAAVCQRVVASIFVHPALRPDAGHER